jgi:PAT family beta-lactamase induction signal transducer AmpG
VGRGQKIWLLVALYLAQGLPYGFFTIALPAMLREAGLSLKAISAASLLALPWILKFLWAPYLDHRGTRRGWLLTLQLSAVTVALVMTQLKLDSGYVLLFAAAFTFNLIAATQDIVTDGLAVRMLATRELGLANAVQVGAYRVGMILGGGLLLWIFAQTNWTAMFICMAALLALTVVPVLTLREPPRDARQLRLTTAQLSVDWLRRLLTPGMLIMAALIFCYRFGDQMLTTLLVPFLIDQGLGLSDIALLKGTVGSATSLIGAALGGWLAFSTGRRNALLVSGVAQAASFGLYVAVALGAGGIQLLWVATVVEGVIGTMATVALFTLMMDASDPEHAGTDYTLLASAVLVVGLIANFCGAAIADAFGYVSAFSTGAALALIGCLALIRVLDCNPISERMARAWRTGAQPIAKPSQTSATGY